MSGFMKDGDRWSENGGQWEGPGDRKEPLSYEDTMRLLRQLWEEWCASGPEDVCPFQEKSVSDQQRRTTVETVVVHHWHPAYRDQQRVVDRNLLDAEPAETSEIVVDRGFECSLPLNLTVVENQGLIHVQDIPTACPLCKRPFSGWELTQISQAASLNYVRREAYNALPPKSHLKRPVPPIDVVFDI